jgi:hypothetical protein
LNKTKAQELKIEDEDNEVYDPLDKEVDLDSAEKSSDEAAVTWAERNGTQNDDSETLFVQVGDHVTYIDLSAPEVKIHVQIVSGQDDLEAGIINETRPLAQTLLDMTANEEFVLSVPGRPIHNLRIVKIKKGRRV